MTSDMNIVKNIVTTGPGETGEGRRSKNSASECKKKARRTRICKKKKEQEAVEKKKSKGNEQEVGIRKKK